MKQMQNICGERPRVGERETNLLTYFLPLHSLSLSLCLYRKSDIRETQGEYTRMMGQYSGRLALTASSSHSSSSSFKSHFLWLS